MSGSGLRPGGAPAENPVLNGMDGLFRQYLAGGPGAAPENWPLQAVLGGARTQLLQRSGLSIPGTPAAYAVLLRDLSREAINSLTARSDFWQGHLKAAFLSGPAAAGLAFPFYTEVEGEALLPETARLFGVIYTWIFTFLGKSPDLNGTRFLDADISSELALHIFLTNPGKMPLSEVEAALQEAFVRVGNFAPPLSCSIHPAEALSPEMALSGYCVYGWERVAEMLEQAWESGGEGAMLSDCQSAVSALLQALRSPQVRAGLASQPLAAETARIVANYRHVRSAGTPTVCLDLLENTNAGRSEWHVENAEFFRHLKTGEYERLVIRDATRDLGDVKGAGKENEFTISRVLGLEAGGRMVPAHDMVLKLRGLTAYRGDINNWLDLLKEYAGYAFIHGRVSGASPYLQDIGPLLLTCEKVSVSFDREETRHWIGFFMRALHPPEQGRAFTCRVRYVTDFWAPRQALGRVQRAARRAGLELDLASLQEKLRELAVWFWTHGLSLTYCDLVLYLDEARRVTGLRVIDFERLTFSELVDEEHLLLDVIVDIKAHLRKETWYPVLTGMFLSRRDPQGFRSFAALRPYLNPKSRRRQLRLRVLRGLQRQASRLGHGGQAVFARFLRVWACLGAFRLWAGVGRDG